MKIRIEDHRKYHENGKKLNQAKEEVISKALFSIDGYLKNPIYYTKFIVIINSLLAIWTWQLLLEHYTGQKYYFAVGIIIIFTINAICWSYSLSKQLIGVRQVKRISNYQELTPTQIYILDKNCRKSRIHTNGYCDAFENYEKELFKFVNYIVPFEGKEYLEVIKLEDEKLHFLNESGKLNIALLKDVARNNIEEPKIVLLDFGAILRIPYNFEPDSLIVDQ